MGKMRKPFDRVFLLLTALLVAVGFFIFSSASLGLLAREGPRYSSVAFNQIFLGIILGGVVMLVVSTINYKIWRQYALHIFAGACFLTLLVFVPGIGLEHGGAHRWLDVGPVSLQPSELLKLAYVVYLAAWFAKTRTGISDYKQGLLPFLAITGVVGAIMLAQPDTGTFIIMAAAGLAMFMAAGARIRDLALVVLAGFIGILLLALLRPYVMHRIMTFINPNADPLGTSYQIQQSLIAIGSGELFGRGFGQSVQKFSFLPEPIGDSVFAVAAEEFGFIGGFILIALFIALCFRGFRIASRAPDLFGALLVLGITVYIVVQSMINIAAMLGLLPLTGVPLVFISHGGTALFIALLGVGIILNVSRHMKA